VNSDKDSAGLWPRKKRTCVERVSTSRGEREGGRGEGRGGRGGYECHGREGGKEGWREGGGWQNVP